MATWDDVRRLALALPQTSETVSRDRPSWCVAGKAFAWERPLRSADLEALGAAAPAGPVLGARTADEGVKRALVADQPDVFFTPPHFDGYPAVLVRLDVIGEQDLTELLVEAWLSRAPKKLAKESLGQGMLDA